MHRVSDNLEHRHPYNDPPFRESANPKEVARAFGNEAVPKYAKLLSTDDLSDEDRCRALQELRELLSNQESKYTAVTNEVLFTCANLADSPDASVRANAALTMAALVLCAPEKVDELSNDVMINAATKLAEDEEQEVAVGGCTIFRNLTISNEGVELLAGKEEIVGKLAAKLTDQPLKFVPLPILELLLETLANLTRVYEGARCAANYPIFSPVLAVLKKPVLYRAESILHATLIVSNAATHEQGKRAAIAIGAVELCLRVLTKNLDGKISCGSSALRDELTRSLVGAIMGLSTSEDAKPQVVEFGVEPLASCLTHASPAVKKNAMIAIRSACESPGGATHFTRRLLGDTGLVVEVLGVKAIPALLACIAGDDEDERQQAIAVLLDLFRSEASAEAAEQVTQTLGLLDVLTALLVDGSLESAQREQVVEILGCMSQVSDGHRRRIAKRMEKVGVDAETVALVTEESAQ